MKRFAQPACFFAIALCCVAAPAQDVKTPPPGLRVFYTGHSFHMFVPAKMEQLVKSAGIQGHKLVGTQGIGGSKVIQHWDLADDKNKAKPALTSGEVDVFTDLKRVSAHRHVSLMELRVRSSVSTLRSR